MKNALPLASLSLLLSFAAQADLGRSGSDYRYLDAGETSVCFASDADESEAQLLPFGGRLCDQRIVSGGTCSFTDSAGQQRFGTVVHCPSVPTSEIPAEALYEGLSASLDPTSGGSAERGLSPKALRSKRIGEFVTHLFEQHPQLLLYPDAYPMSKIRAAMGKAVDAYEGFYRANPVLQADPKKALADLVLRRAFVGQFDPAYQDELKKRSHLIVYDLTKPSTERRFYVIDLKTLVSKRFLVAHGVGSGEGPMAEEVGDVNDSNQTPYGFHVTGKLREGNVIPNKVVELHGLEDINQSSFKRMILIHASKKVCETTGEVGNTHGCAGLDLQVWVALRDRLKDGNLLLFYHKETERHYQMNRKKQIFDKYLKSLR